MTDYGFVTGTFIHPLAGQNPVDRPLGGRVTFFPQDVQHLASPPRTVGQNPEAMVMSATGHVSGWLVAGVYLVQVSFVDRVQLPAFYVHVLDTHTEAEPLDLTTAAPPVPSPNTTVVVSEAERVLAEQAAAEAVQARLEAMGFATSANNSAIAAELARAGMVNGGTVIGDDLHLSTIDGQDINAGNVRGAPGAQGPAGTVTSATASGLATGAQPTVTLGGTPSARTMAFGIPAGATGSPGAAATVGVGTVTTGAAGSNAAVTNSGTSAAAVFNFTIPRGADGNPTAFELRGTGFPEGAVTANPGTYYTDTAGTNGAWRWLKVSGTGNTGWKVLFGDTGWRDVSSLCDPTVLGSGKVHVLKTPGRVTWRLIGPVLKAGTLMTSLPSGYRVDAPNWLAPAATVYRSGAPTSGVFGLGGSGSGLEVSGAFVPDSSSTAYLDYASLLPWPATLPGTPA